MLLTYRLSILGIPQVWVKLPTMNKFKESTYLWVYWDKLETYIFLLKKMFVFVSLKCTKLIEEH